MIRLGQEKNWFNGSHSIETEKAMAPYSGTLAWKIPWMEEPGRLQSMGSIRVRHYWTTSLSLFTFVHWRRRWQPNPVFLPGESQGQGSLVGCHLWGRTESDRLKWLSSSIVLKIKSKICSMTFMWNLKDYKHLNLYVYGFVGFFFSLCKLFQNQELLLS